jgi:hypothetical protein
MPTIREIPSPYRLFFFSFDCGEPKHIHIQRERKVCKYWMEPIALASNHGFNAVELNSVRQILKDNRIKILEAWNEHCSVNG